VTISSPTVDAAAGFASAFVSRDLARRDIALDAFRGLMILGMILVNHPPPTGALYAPLMHAAWNGWTLADTIFPGFLFAVGVAVSLAIQPDASRRSPSARLGGLGRVVRRFLLLMALNLVLINFPYYFGVQLRLNGTLALIAWCYLAAASLHILAGVRTQVVAIVLLLAVQWALLAWLPLPGAAVGTMTPDVNAARHLDALVFSHALGPAWTGQGAETIALPSFGVPALGAIASTLIGMLAGRWMRRAAGISDGLCGLFVVSFAFLAAAMAWSEVLPVNKTLWTGSYVLLMGGIAMQLYATGVWLVREVGARAWAVPLQVAGANALFFYVLAQAVQRILVYGRIRGADGSATSLRQVVFDAYASTGLTGQFGSLVYSLMFLLACYAVVWMLFRRRIFLRL
jgi:predicted acyltransferase